MGVDLFMHYEKPRKDRLAAGHATQKKYGDTIAFYVTEHGEDVHIPRLCCLIIFNMLEATQEPIHYRA